MNNTSLSFSFASILILIFLSSCGGKSVERPAPILTPEQVQMQNTQQAPPTIPTVAGGNVKHYTCPNNCEGSGGDQQGTCPVCGSEYMHNQAYHDQAITQSTQPVSQPNAASEPPQNAAGIWHYTCANGCSGGAGSAVACSTCGNTLVHNTAYHN